MGNRLRKRVRRDLQQWDARGQTPAEARRMTTYTRAAELAGAAGMCATCAFRPGTEANGSGAVLGMVESCMLGGGSFGCHAGGTIGADGFLTAPVKAGECRGFTALGTATAMARALHENVKKREVQR